MKENLLIVGGTGFLGFHFAKEGIIRGFEVYSLSKNPPNKSRFIKEVKYVNIDIMDKNKIGNFLKNLKIDYVINCAGYVDHRMIKDGGENVFDNHFSVTKNLIYYLNKEYLKSFLYLGSSDEYGENPSPQIEEIRESPISPYSFAKVATCHFLQMLNKTENFPAIIFRLFLVYGPNQNKERFLPQLIKKFLRNEKILISPGEQIRDFCYVEDVVSAGFIALKKRNIYGEIFNIASGNPIKINYLVSIVQKIIKKGNPIFGGIDYRENESMSLFASIKKAEKLLKWKPKISLEEGILKTINWFKENDQ